MAVRLHTMIQRVLMVLLCVLTALLWLVYAIRVETLIFIQSSAVSLG